MKPYRKRDGRARGLPLVAVETFAVVFAALAATVSAAENVDPDGDGSQYAYAENVGWINAEPSGDGGPGIEVGMFGLAGWMWGENVGWISLSCQNTSSCAASSYGVENDGGQLSGWAWSENAGWISFACENTGSCGTADYGVTIDTGTGVFAGRAWSENLGWITFASAGPNPYRVKTGWTCLVPAGGPSLSVGKSGQAALLQWSSLVGATAYDVVLGSLNQLRATAGDFSSAAIDCLAAKELGTSAIDSTAPAPGSGSFYLVRAADCGGGTYDTTAPRQSGSRDAELEASGADCP